MRIKHALGTAVIAGALVLVGCSDNGDTTTDDSAGGQPESTQQSFNEADVTFAQDMIPHHQQAVVMAEMAADQAESEEVRQLAADIQAAQGPEIDTMSGWLESWGEEMPEDMSGMDPGMTMGDMPGMMTAQQMDGLTSTSGATFDQMFLTMMIAHHEGAIEMARTEQAEGENPDAVDLAAQIEAQQTAEIATMRGLLGS